MQRAGIESILGLHIQGAFLLIDPCIPGSWLSFEMTLRRGATRYEIRVENPAGVCRGVRHADFDGNVVAERPLRLPLSDDGLVHRIGLILGRPTDRSQDTGSS